MNVIGKINNNIGGVFMATSSITKKFTVKDEKAYLRLVEEVSNKPERTVKSVKTSNLERGNKLLKQFSFH